MPLDTPEYPVFPCIPFYTPIYPCITSTINYWCLSQMAFDSQSLFLHYWSICQISSNTRLGKDMGTRTCFLHATKCGSWFFLACSRRSDSKRGAIAKPPSIFRRFVYDSLLPLLSRSVYYLNAWNRLFLLGHISITTPKHQMLAFLPVENFGNDALNGWLHHYYHCQQWMSASIASLRMHSMDECTIIIIVSNGWVHPLHHYGCTQWMSASISSPVENLGNGWHSLEHLLPALEWIRKF